MKLLHECRLGDKKLRVLLGDLLAVDACALVSSENADLIMDQPTGQSVSAAVHRAEGPGLAASLRLRAPLALGQAIATEAAALPVRYIIHAATVRRAASGPHRFETHAEALSKASESALDLAESLGLFRVAFPAFGVRGAGFAPELAARAQVSSIAARLPRLISVAEVDIVLNDAAVFLHYFRQALLSEISGQRPKISLEISRRGKSLLYHLDLGQTLIQAHEHPLSPEQEEDLEGRLQADLAHVRGAEDARGIGLRLFGLFPSAVWSRLASLEPSVLSLRIEMGLQSLPWEWAGVERSLDSLHHVGRRLTAHGPLESPPEARRAALALIIADPTEDLPAARREGLALLQGLEARGLPTIFLAGRRATRRAVSEALGRCAFVHYAGHATAAGFRLADGDYLPESGPGPRLAVVNACGGVRLGPKFLGRGTRHFLGPWQSVPDEAATGFAAAFYGEILAGESLGLALGRARLKLAEARVFTPFAHYGPPEENLPWLGPSVQVRG